MNPADGSMKFLGEYDSKVASFALDAAYLRGSDRVLIAVDAAKNYFSKEQTDLKENGCVRTQWLDLGQKKRIFLRKTNKKPWLCAKTVVPLHRQKENQRDGEYFKTYIRKIVLG